MKKKNSDEKRSVNRYYATKKELVRIVVDKEKNVSVDPTGKKPGRGAYVSLDPDQIKMLKKKDLLNVVWELRFQQNFMTSYIHTLIIKKLEKNCLVIIKFAK